MKIFKILCAEKSDVDKLIIRLATPSPSFSERVIVVNKLMNSVGIVEFCKRLQELEFPVFVSVSELYVSIQLTRFDSTLNIADISGRNSVFDTLTLSPDKRFDNVKVFNIQAFAPGLQHYISCNEILVLE